VRLIKVPQSEARTRQGSNLQPDDPKSEVSLTYDRTGFGTGELLIAQLLCKSMALSQPGRAMADFAPYSGQQHLADLAGSVRKQYVCSSNLFGRSSKTV
jgi:hypothetical protein